MKLKKTNKYFSLYIYFQAFLVFEYLIKYMLNCFDLKFRKYRIITSKRYQVALWGMEYIP